MSFPQYPIHKDTCHSWLPSLPKDWHFQPIKYNSIINAETLSENTEPDFEFTYIDISSISYGKGITTTETVTFKSSPSRARRIVKEGDILVSTVRTYLKAIAPINSKYEGCIASTGFCVIRAIGDLSSCYARYVLESGYFVESVVAVSVGVSYPATNASDIARLYIPIPPIEDQQAIATFLDHETARIDTLIEKQQRLIALLKEKRQAVISHAVTKGLDPSVPMKDSEVEWLGEVPEHWSVLKVKRIAQMVGGFAFNSGDFTDFGTQLVRIGNLYQSSFDLTRQPTFLPESFIDSHAGFVVKKDDLIISLTGTLGKRDYGFAASVDTDGPFLLNQRVGKIIPDHRVVRADLLLYLLRSDQYLNQIYSLPSGTKQANLSNENVLQAAIAIPSNLTEQRVLVEHIENVTERISTTIDRSEAVISLLTERRTALISAAVTGKIDVRNHPAAKDAA